MSGAQAKEKEKVRCLALGVRVSTQAHPLFQGNAAFKAGDFAAAIGHYSAAIFADRNDATFPLNRAAAYLKLSKYVLHSLIFISF